MVFTSPYHLQRARLADMTQFLRAQLPEAVAGPNAVLLQQICSIKGCLKCQSDSQVERGASKMKCGAVLLLYLWLNGE